MKTTREDTGETLPGELHDGLPGGLGKPLPRQADPALTELARKVAARHADDGGGYGIQRGADGKLHTTTRPA